MSDYSGDPLRGPRFFFGKFRENFGVFIIFEHFLVQMPRNRVLLELIFFINLKIIAKAKGRCDPSPRNGTGRREITFSSTLRKKVIVGSAPFLKKVIAPIRRLFKNFILAGAGHIGRNERVYRFFHFSIVYVPDTMRGDFLANPPQIIEFILIIFSLLIS